MSSMDEPTLEFFIRDSLFSPMAEDKFKAIVALLEPHRESIEYKMREDYNPEEHSWRDYRNSMWFTYEEEMKSAIDKILGTA